MLQHAFHSSHEMRFLNWVDMWERVVEGWGLSALHSRFRDCLSEYIDFVDSMEKYGAQMGMKIHLMHEESWK